jgi:hypothetical protein
LLTVCWRLRSLLMVTGRHVVGVTAGGLGGGEAGRDGGAAVIAAAEGLDWNAWSELESGAQIAQGERTHLDLTPWSVSLTGLASGNRTRAGIKA